MKTVKLMMGAALLLAASMVPAAADVSFTISATLKDGFTAGANPAGTLSGTFTTNNALTTVTGANLTASAIGAFLGFNYLVGTNSTITIPSLASNFFQIDSTAPTAGRELRVFFNSPLTASGTTISTIFSYESEPVGGIRYPFNGTVTATAAPAKVAEPISLSLFGAGIIGAGLIRRRKTAKA